MAEDSARKINPFTIIRRGEDSVDSDENIMFADFSPTPIPADTPEKEIEEPVVDPKDESVPEPAPSPDLILQTALTTSDKDALAPASSEDGAHNQSEGTNQTSS